MSGIEILGIATSVLQIADLGGKLSVKLFVFSRKIKNADKSIDSISQDIAATGAVLQQLGNELTKDEYLRLCSDEAVSTTRDLVNDCNKIFLELDDALDGGLSGNTVVLGWKQRLKYPFLEAQIELLRSNLERLKSSLVVMLNVLIFAGQLRNQETLDVLKDQRELVKVLVEDKNASEKKYRLALKALEWAATRAPLQEATTEVPPPAPAGVVEPARVASVFQTNFVTNAVPKGGAATDKSEAFPVHVWSLPSGLRYRREEIQHHCTLIKNLLNEVSAVRYKIDPGFRDRLHRGVLGVHWEEWAPLRELYGDEALIKVFSQYPEVVRFWVSKLEAEALARLTNRPIVLSIRDLTPVEGGVEMLHPGTNTLPSPSSEPRSSDTLLPVFTDAEPASSDKLGPVEDKPVPATISSDLGNIRPSLDGPGSNKKRVFRWMNDPAMQSDLPAEKPSSPSTEIETKSSALPEKPINANTRIPTPAAKSSLYGENREESDGKPASVVERAASSELSSLHTEWLTDVEIGQAAAAMDRAERPTADALRRPRLPLGNAPIPDDSRTLKGQKALDTPRKDKVTDTGAHVSSVPPTAPAVMSVPDDPSRHKASGRPPLAAVGRVGAAITGLYKNTKRSRRKAAVEELRRQEVEEYSYNPNNDLTLPSVGAVATFLRNDAQTAADNDGYRGWHGASSQSPAERMLVDQAAAKERSTTPTQFTGLVKTLETTSGYGDVEWMKNKSSRADRSKYQFDTDSEDEEMENEIDTNIGSAAGHLSTLTNLPGADSEAHNRHVERLTAKSDRVDDQIAMNTEHLKRIGGEAGLKKKVLSRTTQENRSRKPQGVLSTPQTHYGKASPSYGYDSVNKKGSDQSYGKYDNRPLTAEEEEEEEVMATKQEIRFLKQQDIPSTRNALRMAAQAEGTDCDMFGRLGARGERIPNSEQNLDTSANIGTGPRNQHSTISIYSPALGMYVGPRPYYSGGDGGDIPRPAAAVPPELDSHAAAPASHGYGDTWGRGWKYDPDMLPAHIGPAQQGGTTETSTWAIKDMLTDSGREQTLARGESPKPEKVAAKEEKEEEWDINSMQALGTSHPTPPIPNHPSQQEAKEAETMKEGQTEMGARSKNTGVELKHEGGGGDAIQPQIDDDNDDGAGNGNGNFDVVDKLLMQWTRLSQDEYGALQEGVGLEL